MGSRNSKSNSAEKKEIKVSNPQANNSIINNLDISIQSLDNSLEDTSNYKGIIYNKNKYKDNQIQKSDNYNSDQLTQEKSSSDTNSNLYYNIIWKEGGNNVYIIGNFSDWKKKYKMKLNLSKKKCFFEKEIPINNISKEECIFKFIVDDNWKYSENYPKMKDKDGNINNYIDKAYINEHSNYLKSKNNEILQTQTINESNIKNTLNKSKDNSKDLNNKSLYGNTYPSDEQVNQEAPKMPDVLNILTSLSEYTHQRHIGRKNYLKYSPINFCSSYKSIFQPGHSYINHLLINKKNIKAIKIAEMEKSIEEKYVQINCTIKNKGKCLSILYFSPMGD